MTNIYDYKGLTDDQLRKMTMTNKPRVQFCWECGRKLWGNHFVEIEVDGFLRIMHKSCGRKYTPMGEAGKKGARAGKCLKNQIMWEEIQEQ